MSENLHEILTNPLEYLESKLISISLNKEQSDIHTYITDLLLSNPDFYYQIPLVTEKNNEAIPIGHLVRFRCMIADMYEVEYYSGVCKEVQVSTGESKDCSGKYRDFMPQKNDVEYEFAYTNEMTLDRVPFVCVQFPNQNQWVSDMCLERKIEEETETVNVLKRRGGTGQDNFDIDDRSVVPKRKKVSVKRTSSDTENDVKKDTDNDINTYFEQIDDIIIVNDFKVIVKVYEKFDELKLNDIVEFIGVLGIPDPELETTLSEITLDTFLEDEIIAHNPPHSSALRLHALSFFKDIEVNPQIDIQKAHSISTVFNSIQNDVENIRSEIIFNLSQCCCGDVLAAEYLLLLMVSKIVKRIGVLAIGNFTLNIKNIRNNEVIENLTNSLSLLKPLTTKINLTIEELNSDILYVPKKDYDHNILNTGKLQLADGTILIINETSLEEGTLNEKALQKLSDINSIIAWQKVPYDFQYHTVEFYTDYPVLILTSHNSIFSQQNISICKLPLIETSDTYSMLQSNFTSDILDKFRLYLTLVRSFSETESLSEEVSEVISQKFVDKRKDDPEFPASNLDLWLTLTRLKSMSHFEKNITSDRFLSFMTLENERLSRCNEN